MRELGVLLVIIPFFLTGQTLYFGKYNKYHYKWDLKINNDSTILLVRSGSTYDEYTGSIKSINDTLFNIDANLVFCQTKCRAIGDFLFYLTTDSIVRRAHPNIKVTYSNTKTIEYPFVDKNNMIIPLNKKLFNSNPDKNHFRVSLGHKNPITQEEVINEYNLSDEYCMTIYIGNKVNFKVKIKNGVLKSEGKDQIDKLLLRK